MAGTAGPTVTSGGKRPVREVRTAAAAALHPIDVCGRAVVVGLVTAGGGQPATVALVVRRRRRKLRALANLEPALRVPDVEPLDEEKDERRLLVADRGLGHVVYIVDQHAVPKVEHDGKRHTIH